MSHPDKNPQELATLQLQEQMQKMRGQIESDAFVQRHHVEVNRDLPNAEQFVFDFVDQFLPPFTDMEHNPLFSTLELSDRNDVAVIEVVKDAFKLAKVRKLAGAIEPQIPHGYEAAEGTRAFPNNMLFLNFWIDSGTDPLLGSVDALTQASARYTAQAAAESFYEPSLRYMIDEKGKRYDISTSDFVDPVGNLITTDSHSNSNSNEVDNSQQLHTEGDAEEDKQQYHASIMIGWDISHSLPTFVSIFGTQGLLGKGITLTFSFASDVDGATPFPLAPHDAATSAIDFNPAHTEVAEEYTYHSPQNDKWYRSSRKSVVLGTMPFKGHELTVWGNNTNWNTFGTFSPNEVNN